MPALFLPVSWWWSIASTQSNKNSADFLAPVYSGATMPRRHKIDSAHTHCSFPENLMCSLSLSVLMTPLRIHAASSKEQTTLVSISTFSTSFVNFVFSLSEGVSNRVSQKGHT